MAKVGGGGTHPHSWRRPRSSATRASSGDRVDGWASMIRKSQDSSLSPLNVVFSSYSTEDDILRAQIITQQIQKNGGARGRGREPLGFEHPWPVPILSHHRRGFQGRGAAAHVSFEFMKGDKTPEASPSFARFKRALATQTGWPFESCCCCLDPPWAPPSSPGPLLALSPAVFPLLAPCLSPPPPG